MSDPVCLSATQYAEFSDHDLYVFVDFTTVETMPTDDIHTHELVDDDWSLVRLSFSMLVNWCLGLHVSFITSIITTYICLSLCIYIYMSGIPNNVQAVYLGWLGPYLFLCYPDSRAHSGGKQAPEQKFPMCSFFTGDGSMCSSWSHLLHQTTCQTIWFGWLLLSAWVQPLTSIISWTRSDTVLLLTLKENSPDAMDPSSGR